MVVRSSLQRPSAGCRPGVPGHAHRRRGVLAEELGEHLVAEPEVDRPAVVRVHQRQVPELAALVDVRHPGAGELQRQLHQRVHLPRPLDALLELPRLVEEHPR